MKILGTDGEFAEFLNIKKIIPRGILKESKVEDLMPELFMEEELDKN